MHSTLSQYRVRNRIQSGAIHRVVIVGGGAAGLELATRLGDILGRGQQCRVILVDRSPVHLWKPLLHEIASGRVDAGPHELDFGNHARHHHFQFEQGELADLDRSRKIVSIAAVNSPTGVEMMPARDIEYDTLILAIGSVAGAAEVPGAAEHAVAVDNAAQADHLRWRLVDACMRAQRDRRERQCIGIADPGAIDVVVVGGGITGVELAASLRDTTRLFNQVGLHQCDPWRDIRLTVVEAEARILSGMPHAVSRDALLQLDRLDVRVLAGDPVTEIEEDLVRTASGRTLRADVTVWAGGMQVPPVLSEIGLPVNRHGRVIVSQTLQSILDNDVFAIGDCASCPWPDRREPVPPDAVAARQQARYLFLALRRRLEGKPLPTFRYRQSGPRRRPDGAEPRLFRLLGCIGLNFSLHRRWAGFRFRILDWQHSVALHGFLGALHMASRRQVFPRRRRGLKLY